MLRPSRSLKQLRAAALVLAAMLAGCLDAPTAPRTGGEGRGRLAVYANLTNAEVTTLVIQVYGAGIVKQDGTTPDTLGFNIPLENGVASGSIEVPAGPQRTVVARAFNGLVETHRGSVTTDIAEGTNPTLSITLVPLVGDVPITVSFGTTIIIVRPGVATLAIGDTLRMTAEVRDRDGNIVGNARPRWATLNPNRARVDTLGLVTMVDTGDVQIVATYGTVGGSATLTGTGLVSEVPFQLTWNGSVNRNWNEPNNWTPHGIGAARVPSATDSVVIPAGPGNQPQVQTCSAASVKSLLLQAGASLTTTCGYGVNVYGSARADAQALAPIYLRPGARAAGLFNGLYVYGDSVSLADTVRAAYVEVNGTGARLSLAGRRLHSTGDFVTTNGGIAEMAEGDTLVVDGNVNWSGGDHNGRITGGVLRFRGTSFYVPRYKASGTNRVVFERAGAGVQQIHGMDYINAFANASLQKWDLRSFEGVAICGHVSVADTVTMTATGTELVVSQPCGGYYARAFGPVIAGANTRVASYLWDLRDSSGTAQIGGIWQPSYTEFRGPGTIKAGLNYNHMTVTTSNRFTGATQVAGQLWVEGAGIELDLNDSRVQVGYLEMRGSATLRMDGAADTLRVADYAAFHGETRTQHAAKLTAGLLRIGNYLYGYGFSASGTHKVLMAGDGAGTQRYINGINYEARDQSIHNLEIAAGATYGLCERVRVRGLVTVRAGATLQDWCGGPYLRIEGDLETEAGSTVQPYLVSLANVTGTSKVNGAWSPAHTDFAVADGAIRAGLAYQHLRIFAPTKLLGATATTGYLWIDGGAAQLDLNGNAMAVGQYLDVRNGGSIVMQNPADSLDITTYAAFHHDFSASQGPKLTAGVLRIGDYLHGYGFAASPTGTHRVVFTGAAAGTQKYIGSMNSDSRSHQVFRDLEFAGGTYGLCERVRVKGTVRVRTGATVQDWCGSPHLIVEGDLVTEAGSTVKPYNVALVNTTGTANVSGVFTPAWTSIHNTLAAGQLKPALGYTNMAVYVPVALGDSLRVNGELYMSGATANVNLNGHRMHVAGQMNLDNSATITMQDPADTLVIEGRAYWDAGASHAGKLTAGTVIMRGDVMCANWYFSSGAHRTVFDRDGGQVAVQCVNTSNPTAHPFNHVVVQGAGIQVWCGMYATGNVHVAAGARVDTPCNPGSLWIEDTLTVEPSGLVTNGPSWPASHNLSVVLYDSVGTKLVQGTYNAQNTYFLGLNAWIRPDLDYKYVRIDRSTAFRGPTEIDSWLEIINDATVVDLNGQHVTLRGGMDLNNQSRIRMASAADTLDVAVGDPSADMYWDGADQTGYLTAGVVRYYGDRFVGTQFRAAGSHKFVFASDASGAAISVESHPVFRNVEVAGLRSVSANSRITVYDTMRVSAATLVTGTDYIHVVDGGAGLYTVAGSDITIPNFYVDAPSGTANVNGRFRPTWTMFRAAAGTANAIRSGLEYNNVSVEGMYALSGPITTAGHLQVRSNPNVTGGGPGELTMNGHRATVGGDFEAHTAGVLTMNRRGDTISTGGTFRLQGSAGPTQLDSGVVMVGGNFFALDRDGVALRSAKLVMNGAGSGTQFIYASSNGNRNLRDVELTGTRTVTFGRDANVMGNLRVLTPISLTSGSHVYVGDTLSTVAGSAMSWSSTLYLAGPTGTGLVDGSFANSWYTRFLAQGGTIRAGSGKSYTHMEIDAAVNVSGGKLAIGGELRVYAGGAVTLPDSSTVGGSIETYGDLRFAGYANTTFDLAVRWGGQATALGANPGQVVDFRNISVNGANGQIPAGILNNNVSDGRADVGFRYRGSYSNSGVLMGSPPADATP